MQRQKQHTGPSHREEEVDEEMCALLTKNYSDWLRDNADLFESFPTLGLTVHMIEDKRLEIPAVAITTQASYCRIPLSTEKEAKQCFNHLVEALRNIKTPIQLKAYWKLSGLDDKFHPRPGSHICRGCSK